MIILLNNTVPRRFFICGGFLFGLKLIWMFFSQQLFGTTFSIKLLKVTSFNTIPI